MEEMFSVGNLLSEIFETKDEIIQQVKRQTDLYAKHLRWKLLVQGIPPPPWLLEDAQCSQAPAVLNREDLIPRAELPKEIIEDVLLRLPAKSVARFRCASKAWQSLLTSSKFVKSHHDLHVNNSCATSIIIPVPSNEDADPPIPPHLQIMTTDGNSRKVTSPLFRGEEIILHAVCYGFVLVEIDSTVLMFNPTTLEALEVPECKLHLTGAGDQLCRLDFTGAGYHLEPDDHYGCVCNFGLGYDSSSDDYKIVRLVTYNHMSFEEVYADVYSFRRKSWSRKTSIPYSSHHCPPNLMTFVNGRLHWQAYDANKGFVIVALNLAREDFEEISPPTEEYFSHGSSVAVFEGCLATLLSSNYHTRRYRTRFWVLKEYGNPESWHKIKVSIEDGYIGDFVCLLGEDELVLKPGHYSLDVYSLSTGVLRKWDIGVDFKNPEKIALPFTECLLSPSTYRQT